MGSGENGISANATLQYAEEILCANWNPLALAVAEGRWPADAATRQALSRRTLVQALAPHCDHGLDVGALLDRTLAHAPSEGAQTPGHETSDAQPRGADR